MKVRSLSNFLKCPPSTVHHLKGMASVLKINTKIPAKTETVENLLNDFLGRKTMVSQGMTRCISLITVVAFI